jgi:hypothetical protein
MGSMPRRDFLIATPAALGVFARAARGEAPGLLPHPTLPAPLAAAEYGIRAKRHAEVKLTDAFWRPKFLTNATVTIPFEVAKRSGSGRGLSGNVLEAAIYSLESHPDPALQAQVEAQVRELAAQRPGGNRGFEVAAAYFNATGRRDLLDPAIAAAEAIREEFRLNDPPFNGGERDAINCLQLYRVTGDQRHLDLAKHYLDIRGRPDSVNRSRHNQAHMPTDEMREAVGHAVNCVTLMVSLADVGVLTGDRDYLTAAQAMWRDAVARKMYVTGGVGTTGNEGFGEPYSLPNISAYAETCAVLMFITLNHRLFLATGDARYIDVMERGMYNNAIDGVSATGDHYFYVNRLASAGDGRDHRWQRASLECCPPNLVRFLASMPGYIYAQGRDESIYVNLYVGSEAAFRVRERDVTLSVETDLPWAGRSTLRVATAEPVQGTIRLRIPGWAVNRPAPEGLYSYAGNPSAQPTIAVNGSAVRVQPDRTGYVSIERRWTNGDVIAIEFPMEVRRVIADDRVRDCARRIAVERGPIVYCAEWPDVEGGRVLDLLFDRAAELTPSLDRALFGGATVIRTVATRMGDATSQPVPVTLIPYHLWANRGIGEMTTWLPVEPYVPGDIGPAGGFIFYENPDWATDGWRWLEAAPFDQSAGAPWGCFRTLIDGARGTAIGTGRQNTQDILAACADPVSAAALCANLNLNGVVGWFLPSRDELAEMYRALRARNIGDFRDDGMADNAVYWASTQSTADMAAHIDFADWGRLHGDDKDFPRRVRAIRAF